MEDSPSAALAANRWVWYQPMRCGCPGSESRRCAIRRKLSPVKVKCISDAPVRSAGIAAVTFTR